MVKILFVCMGNLCRSPAAEGILKRLIEKHRLQDQLSCASAGTSGAHVGAQPDPRTQQTALKRGYQVQGKARQFKESDFEDYDYIIPMDKNNWEYVNRIAPDNSSKKKIVLMTRFSVYFNEGDDVPDPFYGEEADFEEVLDILEDACMGLLLRLKFISADDD